MHATIPLEGPFTEREEILMCENVLLKHRIAAREREIDNLRTMLQTLRAQAAPPQPVVEASLSVEDQRSIFVLLGQGTKPADIMSLCHIDRETLERVQKQYARQQRKKEAQL